MNSNEIESYKSLREKIIKQINIVLPQYCEIKKYNYMEKLIVLNF